MIQLPRMPVRSARVVRVRRNARLSLISRRAAPVLDLGQNCCDKEGMDKSLAIICSIPFFSGLSREQLAEVGRIAVEKRFRKGEVIFSEGDEGDGFYLVIDGRVKVFKLSADGKEHILHVFAAGQPFGEVPVFAGEQFPANAAAIADTRAMFFPRAAFLTLIGKNPLLAMKMLSDLSHKLRQFSTQIENLSLKEIPSRLASYLLYLASEQSQTDQVESEHIQRPVGQPDRDDPRNPFPDIREALHPGAHQGRGSQDFPPGSRRTSRIVRGGQRTCLRVFQKPTKPKKIPHIVSQHVACAFAWSRPEVHRLQAVR